MKIDCKTGEYELPAALLEAYAAIYPTADQEFARMVIWLESNPSRRPASAKSAPRFIQNWFKRVPKRVQTKQDQRADTVGRLIGTRAAYESVVPHIPQFESDFDWYEPIGLTQ